MDIQKEFDQRTFPVVLRSYETCKYEKICPYVYKESQYYCRGTNPYRDGKFICDIQKLKN